MTHIPERSPPPFHLKYRADFLLGCSYLALHPNHPSAHAKENAELWWHTEPHLAFFNESQQRIQAMVSHVDPAPKKIILDFEKRFNFGLQKALKPEGLIFRSSSVSLTVSTPWSQKFVRPYFTISVAAFQKRL